MKLYASEDEDYQIRTGREIVETYPEIYNQWIIQDIKNKLKNFLPPVIANVFKKKIHYCLLKSIRFFCDLL